MKGFLTYLLVLLGIIIVFQYIGEWGFTYVYNHGSYRNKVMWVRDLEPNQQLDFIILGNSRANYHIDPTQIEAATGAKGYNIAYNASHPFDSELMLREVIKRTQVTRVFVQLDHSYRTQTPDEVGMLPWLPYINEAVVQDVIRPYDSLYHSLSLLPFYRYQKYESELGFRNVALSVMGKAPNFLELNGFTPQDYAYVEKGFEPFVIQNKNNPSVENLMQICRDNNIEIVFFTAPVYQFEGDYDVLATRVDHYTNLSKSIKDSALFVDEIHLNREGARQFTALFIKHFFK